MIKTAKHTPCRRQRLPVLNQRGYTLPELLVVMTIFLIIIMVTSNGFKTVVSQVGQQSKSMETEIGSIVGLELLRSDVQNAGYGLPWSFLSSGTTPPGSPPSVSQYTEIGNSDSGGAIGASFWPTGTSPATFNDAPSNAPRAVQNGNTTFNKDSNGVGSQYLVIKSLSVAPGATQKKWVTVTYGSTGNRNPLTVYGTADRDLASTDQVIVLRNSFVDNVANRQLQTNGGTFSAAFNQFTTLTQPHSSSDVFQVYGVNPADAGLSLLRMPFNRADYYVKTPASMPPACAPNTGILYKAYASQKSSGGFTEIPLLDCVADMQVAYGLGGSDGAVNSYVTTLTGLSASDIRNRVKEIRLYILGQEGKKDPGFSYPSTTINVGETLQGISVGRTFDLSKLIGGPWKNYRWKLYTIVVRPKNLIQ
ncbi:MAG TPA: PilW family protein [Geomonas sp.]|nr:PilW family protein [Geomonas sp.]